jgi:TPP-dependent pyruvate/acetoin dehydrogenase alpha subunit
MSHMDSPNDHYRQMLRIRRFEETVLDSFPRGLFYGTTHTYIGQEANAVGVLSWLDEGDVVVSNHRCHGHFLAYGGPMYALAAELMGRATGVCEGRGGSQHIHWRDFYANGVLGGTVPLAVGMAKAEKARRGDRTVFVFLGDGALGEGVVYESLNMASLWELPLLFVLENNRYAQSTPISLNLAGKIPMRFRAFGIEVDNLDSTDVVEIRQAAGERIERVRSGDGPQALVLHTYRFSPHSKGDDTRDPNEIAFYRKKDPLPLHGERVDPEERREIEDEVEQEVRRAFEQAASDPTAERSALTPPLELGA